MKNLTVKEIINDLLLGNRLGEDKAVTIENKLVIFQSAGDHNIYVYNKVTKRAYQYIEGIGGLNSGKQITTAQYKAQCDALKARKHADEVRAEREAINKWKREHNEAVDGVAPSVVDNNEVNAPATKTAVLLDAEREDSKFDFRKGEDILSVEEADTYEQKDSLLDEDKDELVGYHRHAILTAWKNELGWVETLKDGSQKFHSPYVSLTFDLDGKELVTRAYSPQFKSFKIQANYNYHKLFEWMKDSNALNTLVDQQADFEVWVKFNDLLGKHGEYQAEFYDREAYMARHADKAKMAPSAIRSGYHRRTENEAIR